VTQGPLTGEDREFAGNLLDIAAHWCDESMRLGAEFAQAFVEATADVQLESVVTGGRARRSGTMTQRRYGTGLLLRHRGAWWYGSAPLASPGELAERMAAIPGLGTPRPARPWHDISPAEARDLAWDGLPPGGQAAAGPPGGHTRVQFIQDYFRQYRAVADSAGVRRCWRVGGGRQRATATIVSGGTRARSFARRASGDWGEPGTGDDLAACAGDLVSAAVGRAGRLLTARGLGSRSTPVVFAPRVGAALLHELIGHALEADNFARDSPYTAGLAGAPLCDAPLDLVDDPAIAGGIGSSSTDDDGQPCRYTPLVRRGTVVGQLSCVRSAYGSAEACSGSGRRQGYASASLPRASNTVVLPGPDSAAALAEPPPEGLLYVAALSSGEISLSRGEFCFSAAESYYLTGAGSQPLRDVNLSGDARAALARLAGIAGDLEGDNVTCGKQGQSVHIGLFSPTMRFDRLTWWS
jgi:predicted Zn-dependent protease